MANYTKTDTPFVNPYNFVALKSKPERKELREYKQGDLLTGKIQCKLELKTPIFIPNTSVTHKEEETKQVLAQRFEERNYNGIKLLKNYEFYSYEDLNDSEPKTEGPSAPVIPGSEIRGIIRSAFETVTNSCMSTIDDDDFLYKRTTDPAKVKNEKVQDAIGILNFNEQNWKIEVCKKYILKISACDADSNFISGYALNPNILSDLSTYKTRKGWPIFDIKKNRIDREFQEKINNKLSISIDEIRYHTKMTIRERDTLLRYFSKHSNLINLINNLFKASQQYHDIDDFRDGQPVYFTAGEKYKNLGYMPNVITNISSNNFPGCIRGIFHRGEPFGTRKHHEAVIVPIGKTIEVSENSVIRLKKNIEYFQDEKVNIHLRKNSHKGYSSNIKNMKDKEIKALSGKIVYFTNYFENSNDYYLSPGNISRQVFHNKLKDLIGEYAACESQRKLCPACALFGFVSETKSDDNVLGGRVRFADAHFIGKAKPEDYDDPGVLKELASPKTSSTEFYMIKPDAKADLWNYDYWLDKQRNPHKNPNKILLRGRKFYWHHKNPNDYFERNESKYSADRHIAVRPLKKGSFEFEVYFDGITEDELLRLAWTLEIGNKASHAHKIGMAKPYGLGSVKITAQNICLREVSIESDTISYKLKKRLADIRQKYEQIENEVRLIADDFLIMTDYENAPSNIQYPTVLDEKGNDSSIYEWFVANRQTGNGASPFKHIINQELMSPEKINKGNMNTKFEGLA